MRQIRKANQELLLEITALKSRCSILEAEVNEAMLSKQQLQAQIIALCDKNAKLEVDMTESIRREASAREDVINEKKLQKERELENARKKKELFGDASLELNDNAETAFYKREMEFSRSEMTTLSIRFEEALACKESSEQKLNELMEQLRRYEERTGELENLLSIRNQEILTIKDEGRLVYDHSHVLM